MKVCEISQEEYERTEAARKTAELSRLKHIEQCAKWFLRNPNGKNKKVLQNAVYPPKKDDIDKIVEKHWAEFYKP